MKTRAASTLIKLINETNAKWVKADFWEEDLLQCEGLELGEELFRSVLGPYHARIKFPVHMKEDIIQTILNQSKRITRADAESVLWVFMEDENKKEMTA